MGAAFAAINIGGMLKNAIGRALDLTEAGTAIQAVFGDAAQSIGQWAKAGATMFGENHITVQSVLDGWATARLRTGRKPSEFWSLQASLHRTSWLRDYNVGDYCDIIITADPYIADGIYRRRILELAGNHDGLWVTITCGNTFD